MRRPTVPEDQVAGFSAHFDPLATVSSQPFHPFARETVPFGVPGRDRRFPCHFVVKLCAEFVCAATDDQTAVVGAVGEEIY